MEEAEWFGSVLRKDIVVTMFKGISLNALEERYGRLTISAAMNKHKIHYDENTITLRVNSKAIKFGTLIQTVAHGEEAERMTCLTPEGTLDVQVDKEGRIFDEARRWRCDVPDSTLKQSQSDIETQVRSDSDSDSEISETQELELPEGLEVMDDVPQHKTAYNLMPRLPMPRLRKRHFDPDAFEYVQKYDEDGSSAPYSKEEYKGICQRLCEGSTRVWHSLHVFSQADIYTHAFTDFVLKWTDLKCDLVDIKGKYMVIDGDVVGSNDFNYKLYDDIEYLIIATRGPDEVHPTRLVESLRIRNVAIRVNTNNKRMKTYIPLRNIDFTIGTYSPKLVELKFYQRC